MIALYCRLSYDRSGEGVAVARQEEMCRAKIASLGLSGAVKVYSDNSVSALKNRPAFNDMMKDAKAGQLNTIVCYDTYRLSRQPRQNEEILDVAKAQNIQLFTVSGDIDLSTENGRFMFRQLGIIGAMEVETSGRRKRDANASNAKLGKQTIRKRPFGYNKDGSLHPTESVLVRKAYEDVAAGKSLNSTVTKWNRLEVKTTSGNRWESTQLKRVLLRPRNCGLTVHQGKVVGIGDWEPIVDKETFDVVGDVLADPTRRTNTDSVRSHLLTKLIHCTCQDGAVLETATRGKRRDIKSGKGIYRCNECTRSISIQKADEVVRLRVALMLTDPSKYDSLQQMVTDGDAVRIGEIRAELGQITKDEKLLSNSGVSLNIILDQGRKLQEQRKTLEVELQTLQERDALSTLVLSLTAPVQVIPGVRAWPVGNITETRQNLAGLDLADQRLVIGSLVTITCEAAEGSYDPAKRLVVEPKSV